jgi:hypothetical protein
MISSTQLSTPLRPALDGWLGWAWELSYPSSTTLSSLPPLPPSPFAFTHPVPDITAKVRWLGWLGGLAVGSPFYICPDFSRSRPRHLSRYNSKSPLVGSVGWVCGRVFPVYLSRLLSLFSLHPFSIPAVRKNKLAWLGGWVGPGIMYIVAFEFVFSGSWRVGWAGPGH